MYLSRFLVHRWLGHFVQVLIHSFANNNLTLNWVCNNFVSLHAAAVRQLVAVTVLLHFPRYHLTFIRIIYLFFKVNLSELFINSDLGKWQCKQWTISCCRAYIYIPWPGVLGCRLALKRSNFIRIIYQLRYRKMTVQAENTCTPYKHGVPMAQLKLPAGSKEGHGAWPILGILCFTSSMWSLYL